MRTKNVKRLWPVPTTLAVMALAAFLAFGLMATTGIQPAAAQAGGDCTSVDQGGDADPGTIVGDQATFSCEVTSSNAIITLTNGGNDEHKFYVFAENIGSGAASVYPPDTEFNAGAFRSGILMLPIQWSIRYGIKLSKYRRVPLMMVPLP